MTIDISALKPWIGRQEKVADPMPLQNATALAATLDRAETLKLGDALPPLWHWTYFLPMHRQSEIADDGHAKRGGFIPPVALPRRMFAGAKLTFTSDLRIGDPATRISTITGLDVKQGRTGELVFLRIRNEFTSATGQIVEEQDIVYREHPRAGEKPPAPRPPPAQAVWQREFRADIMLLFRYSALIFNAHRIHYDRDYATRVEGYPGLVVHGQLIATLLAELVHANTTARMTAFRFRSLRPLFDTRHFTLCGAPQDKRVLLWAQDAEGAVAMEAEAELA